MIKQKSNSDTTTANHSGKFSIGDGVLVSGINFDGEGKRFSGSVVGVFIDNGNMLYDVEFWGENSPGGPFEGNLLSSSTSTVSTSTVTPLAPRKNRPKKQPKAKLLREMRRTAAVYKQSFVSGYTETTSAGTKWDCIEE